MSRRNATSLLPTSFVSTSHQMVSPAFAITFGVPASYFCEIVIAYGAEKNVDPIDVTDDDDPMRFDVEQVMLVGVPIEHVIPFSTAE